MERIKIVDKDIILIREFLGEMSSTFLRIYEQFAEKHLSEG